MSEASMSETYPVVILCSGRRRAKANRLLGGWRPRHGMAEGLARTVGWYQQLLTSA